MIAHSPLEDFRARPGVRRLRASLAMAGRRLAFAVESLALATLALLILSFLVVRADWYGVAWEWGRFWTHYASAAPAARRPIEIVLIVSLAITTGLIGWARFAAARSFWRFQERAGG